ncbi:hypothetical protein SELMODRAFT_173430 [Selaginella moellendorffii]|uniref:Methyltransferase type 11 domain-containing protein n=1 Tax=Selaginella moellendorffii TaxID=88036 RepID=D8RR23_SELML|nr:probable tocopherol O-methyltransferase, chloroplastic [Selaginella moellendorffii]EFJ25322.1 hypothetical protein SELMODRAFT_173430 [Selaginella moellendorffii]|eukprot:XP_002973662.1 probable tocopherol O-methyltransferase, chloroplastic [Selaginella moellendorffii]
MASSCPGAATAHSCSSRPTPWLWGFRSMPLSQHKISAAGSDSTGAAMTAVTSKGPPVPEELNRGIARFYDSSSSVWEDVWGEHMHHGFYDPGKPLKGDHRAAQVRMIEEALAWAGIPADEEKPKKIVDVGCGIGGSARHLSRKYSAMVRGITLSPVQAQRANNITAEAGLGEKVSFQVADALNQPFPDNEFDLVWSMESGEHMPDKRKFMQELVRVAAPGGRLLIVTWCHRDLSPEESSLRKEEQELLDKICSAYYLPAWCSAFDYVELAKELQLEDVRAEDWSVYVSPFWPAVIASALNPKALFGLLRSGWTTIRGAFAMTYMIQGYKSGLIKFAVITGRKPVAR